MDEHDGHPHDPEAPGFARQRPEPMRAEQENYLESEPQVPEDGGLAAAVEEMERIADEYGETGWETLACHPGGVEIRDGEERTGIEIGVPDNELEAAEDLLAEGAVSDYQVYKNQMEGLLFFVVAMEDHENEAVLLYCGYYEAAEAGELFERAESEGELRVYLRNTAGEYVELVHPDPAFFGPVGG